jgi:class 3 adenylate cyclase
MSEKGFKRKLAAIISADVVGYSRLMDDDEEATIRTLTTYRKLLTSIIQQYRGKVVDTTGDNLLAEFASAVDAVNCAVEIQRELAERNTELPYERRMEFRIGVNVGDVVEEQDRPEESMTRSKISWSLSTNIWESKRLRISPSLCGYTEFFLIRELLPTG